MPTLPLELQQPVLHHTLCRDTGMIEPGRMERRIPFHPVPPCQRILQRGRQRVTDVQATRDVWRRRGDDKDAFVTYVTGVDLSLSRGVRDLALCALLVSGRKEALGHPPVVPCRFHRQGVVRRLGQVTGDVFFVALGRGIDEFLGDGDRGFLFLLYSRRGLLPLARLIPLRRSFGDFGGQLGGLFRSFGVLFRYPRQRISSRSPT